MNSPKKPLSVALTIAGSDPSGGAGLQADLKTFHQHQVYGQSVVTLITVQNTTKVSRVEVLTAELVEQQLQAVLEDILPTAAKTGALGNASVIEAVADKAKKFQFPLVVDPVMVSKHGALLMNNSAVEVLKSKLLPLAYLVTPNLHEASLLAGIEVTDIPSMQQAAKIIADLGVANVLVKGGHLSGAAEDQLLFEGQFHSFSSDKIDTNNTHGTGCVFSAAITAWLSQGESLYSAINYAKEFVTEAIKTNPHLGHGYGPLNLHVAATKS